MPPSRMLMMGGTHYAKPGNGSGLFLAPGARHGAKKHISRHRSDHRTWAVDDTAASSANGAGSERFLRKTGTHLQTAGASVPD